MEMAKQDQGQDIRVCQAVSNWDEPCDMAAVRRCERCGLWFCGGHFSDPNWHPCVAG